ncbi:uncharacterized protein LOC142978198 [Anticarsia gemmatalis]|uniref:uncharacterized protein LOC142978198 n=1 Tax=Anticarsia gemmatalis TaxID=129554 RepID=UPI003F7744CB
MKLILVLMLCALAAAAPNAEKPNHVDANTAESRNWVLDQAVNQLIRQLISYVRRIINNGSSLFDIPPLDPLELEHIHLEVPAGLINLDLDLKNILATGIGGFVVHRSRLNVGDLTFDLDISVPSIDVSAEHYDLIGDFLTAIPLYGKGSAVFKAEGFRLQAKLYLEPCENNTSVLIKKIENAAFEIPSFKSQLTGAIGGGDIDGIVNAVIDEVLVDYVNRFQGAISTAVAKHLPALANPVLGQLDTWKYIALLPGRPRE